MRPKNKKDITKTDVWEEAVFDYSAIISESMMPSFLGKPLSGMDRINAMKKILKRCPQFYPAAIDAGQNYFILGKDAEGTNYFNEGFKEVKENFSEKEIFESYGNVTNFLEGIQRYDDAAKYYMEWADSENDVKKKAMIYDDIVGSYYELGKIDEAILLEEKAIEMHPSAGKYSNMGWLQMIKGNLDAAENFLKKALEMDKNHEIAKENLGAFKFMRKNKIKNWEAYMLRKIDYDYLEKLEDEDSSKYAKVVNDYNACRIYAFETYLVRNDAYSPSKKQDIFFHTKFILNFIAEKDYDDEFLYDDVLEAEIKFEKTMCKFISEMKDVDEEIINMNCIALLEFYKFLKANKLISKDEYNSLKKEIDEAKDKILDKMHRYNKIRNKPDVTQEEKAKAREKILGIYDW